MRLVDPELAEFHELLAEAVEEQLKTTTRGRRGETDLVKRYRRLREPDGSRWRVVRYNPTASPGSDRPASHRGPDAVAWRVGKDGKVEVRVIDNKATTASVSARDAGAFRPAMLAQHVPGMIAQLERRFGNAKGVDGAVSALQGLATALSQVQKDTRVKLKNRLPANVSLVVTNAYSSPQMKSVSGQALADVGALFHNLRDGSLTPVKELEFDVGRVYSTWGEMAASLGELDRRVELGQPLRRDEADALRENVRLVLVEALPAARTEADLVRLASLPRWRHLYQVPDARVALREGLARRGVPAQI